MPPSLFITFLPLYFLGCFIPSVSLIYIERDSVVHCYILDIVRLCLCLAVSVNYFLVFDIIKYL